MRQSRCFSCLLESISAFNPHFTWHFTETGVGALKWAERAESLGAGGILVTSMDADGTGDGYDLDQTGAIADAVNILVIASGAGKLEHFCVFARTKADASRRRGL